MLRCGVCHRWYHFPCVHLAERDGEDLAYYVCPTCTSTTGKASRELWELDDDEIPEIQIEGIEVDEPRFPPSSDEEGSEDNFAEETRVGTVDESSDVSDGETIGARTHRHSARKRRSISKHIDQSVKRHKPETSTKSSNSSPEDPIRKSCLKILINLLTPIFSERLPEDPSLLPENGDAESFATSLESSLFEIYAEQDDFGDKTPGNKYKSVVVYRHVANCSPTSRDRIRMLNFNLGKKDRQELRKSIRVGQITPEQLSRMSSIDLANTLAQQEAQKLAEEAMNHSILQARTAPLRKITHKGEEMIEKIVEEDNWRIQEEDRERERERERQRSRVGSLSESVPPTTPASASFRRLSLDLATSTNPHEGGSSTRLFDPASTVFKIDFDGEGSNTLSNGPPTPPELTGTLMNTESNILGDHTHDSPASPSTSPTVQQFSLDGLFGRSQPTRSAWSESPDPELSNEPQSATGEDFTPPDDTDFDAFITVDEDEPEPVQAKAAIDKPNQVTETELLDQQTPSLADLPSIWRGHLGMPSADDPNRVIQFQSEFKQIGGPAFHDTPQNRSALFPTSLLEIIGRVPTSHAVKYLVSMRLNPTKELFAVALVPNEADKPAYIELHKLLIQKDRYGLVFPWGQDPQLSAPGKEFYVVPLLPEHPIPEYLQLLDNVKIAEHRDSPIFCGIFVLNKGRVTSLNAIDYSSSSVLPVAGLANPPLPPPGLGSGDLLSGTSPPGPSVSLPNIPPALAPALSSSLANLSESTLATLTKDLANLNPTQLELVRSLLLRQSAPDTTHTTTPANSGEYPHAQIHAPQGPALPGPIAHNPPPTQHTPASWDRPASYTLESNWIPGPGYIARDEPREERRHWVDSHRNESRGDHRVPRGRGAGHSGSRGRGVRGRGRW
ncbi:transcription elongation factor S-II [Ceratobasidium sp. AG-Ba]|nr:transcription elongation factor S-II [Ceratobasidium sp. AG-Ba]